MLVFKRKELMNKLVQAVASFKLGSKLAKWLFPFFAGLAFGAVGVMLFLHKGCNGGDLSPINQIAGQSTKNDSILALMQKDSAQQAGKDSIRFVYDTAVIRTVKNFYNTIPFDSADYLAKIKACDSLNSLYTNAMFDQGSLIRNRDQTIAILIKRLAECQKDKQAIVDTARSIRKPVQLPSVIRIDANAFLGVGLGTTLGVRADAAYNRIGLFMQVAGVYSGTFYPQLVGGIVYYF
jgi:hypothetical protein